MSRQKSKQKKRDEEAIRRSITLRGFSHLTKLNMSYLNLPNLCVMELLRQLNVTNLPINELDLSGNHVGYQGCKLLNKNA